MATNDSTEETIQKQLLSFNLQIIALLATIFAISLTIYVLEGYKDLMVNKKNAKVTIEELQRYTNLATAIILVVSIYFVLLAFDNFDQNKTVANTNYLAAAIFVLMAASLRYYSVRKYPQTATSADDIV